MAWVNAYLEFTHLIVYASEKTLYICIYIVFIDTHECYRRRRWARAQSSVIQHDRMY